MQIRYFKDLFEPCLNAPKRYSVNIAWIVIVLLLKSHEKLIYVLQPAIIEM